MDVNSLEEMIDEDIVATNTTSLSSGTQPLPANTSSSGIELDSPQELVAAIGRLAIGEVTLVSVGNLNEEGIAAVVFRDSDGEHIYRVNSMWRDNIINSAEEIAVSNGAAVSPNSPSLEMDIATSRFSGAIWYEKIQEQSIVLAGVGGIGSYVAFLLGRMKPRELIMYDPDVVEMVNMSGQLYKVSDIGLFKVVAVRNMIKDYCGYMADAIANNYGVGNAVRPIMICGFDNMAARRVFYDAWKDEVSCIDRGKDKYLFIDGRLAAEEYQVFAIQGNDDRAMAEYEDKWLFNDTEAEATVCSYKQTTFMANMIASTMVNIFVNFVANLCNPAFPREVPFFTSYDASTMFTKIKS